MENGEILNLGTGKIFGNFRLLSNPSISDINDPMNDTDTGIVLYSPAASANTQEDLLKSLKDEKSLIGKYRIKIEFEDKRKDDNCITAVFRNTDLTWIFTRYDAVF